MRQFRKLAVPQHAHPLVVRLIGEMNRQQIGMFDLGERAGVSPYTIQNWTRRGNPTVPALEACFGALGMSLVVRHREGPGRPDHVG